jgi:sugar phosphate isomerase/epimerase
MIGMPALIEFDSLEDNLKLCQSLGLDFIELNLNLPMYNEMNIKETQALLKQYDVKVSIHLSELFNPFELDPILRQAHIDVFKRVVNMANHLDAFLLNMHLLPGIHFKLPSKKVYLYETYNDIYMTYVKDFRQLVESLDVKALCIENVGIHDADYIQMATDILIASESINLTYDIGHDITSGYKDKAYFTNNQSKIKHYHIHDGNAKKNHLALFTGDLAIEHFVKTAQASGASAVIEVKSSESLITSINLLKERKLI